ncbi:MAG: pantoate--beta-alanine ligase [Pseudomonadota bacterium]
MIILNEKTEIQARLETWRRDGERIGVAPTMGALHEGHLSLIDALKSRCDRVVATIFVNPLQFAPSEDFSTYPRDMEGDLAQLRERGCDAVFAPDREALFPNDFSTTVSVGDLRENHCALTRPQFFDGVATIVAKFLMILRPDAAVFGEKDYQQLQVIRRMARDLDMGIEIIGAPIIREPDGLAMSSRNAYLSHDERRAAPALFKTLTWAARESQASKLAWSNITAQAEQRLTRAGYSSLEYFNLVDANTLEVLESPRDEARILAAAWIGKTRLIDNIAVAPL